jgi:aspartyl-tRNA(Asn)/glutamyl-tRNA(Gln) amidotransferase subunit A
VTLGDVASYRQAYRSGARSPLDVAEAFLAAHKHLDAFVAVDHDGLLHEAREAAGRLARGTPRGPLEGVLIGIKDFFHVAGLPTRAGTGFLRADPNEDAPLVARLRAAGAVIAGKTRATELGLSPIGINAVGGTPRNPHDQRRVAGGPSSGSAAAVAGGLVPLAVGTDGGGSVRVPAAMCGVYGFKPSWGRIPMEGQLPHGWWSVSHAGPLARSVADLALGYAVMAGIDPPDLNHDSPPRVGVDWTWWGDPDPDVDRCCRTAIAGLDPVPVKLEHLDLVRIAAYVTIGVETAAGVYEHLRADPSRFGADTQITLAAAQAISGVDYVRAQQARTLIAGSFAAVLKDVDVLAAPTTACTAPLVSPGSLRNGLLDEALLQQITATTFPANLAGLPAVTVPVGLDREGLPIGLMLIAARGDDDLVLRAAAHLERMGVARVDHPRVWTNMLGEA